jgi:hypothetical protein
MDGAPLQGLDVDGQYLPVADQVQEGGEVVGTAAESRPAFDDEVRTGLDQDLLVSPQVERALERAIAEPRQGDRAAALPGALLPGVVVGPMEGVGGGDLVRPQRSQALGGDVRADLERDVAADQPSGAPAHARDRVSHGRSVRAALVLR